MQPENGEPAYKIWGVDNVVYGPVDLPTLVNWVQEERVTADTWTYSLDDDTWLKAAALPQLHLFFKAGSAAPGTTVIEAADGESLTLTPGSLRRIKVFAGLSDEQIRRFVGFMQLQKVRAMTEIIRSGNPGDAMYLILGGEVRIRLMIAGKESVLATLWEGEFFGEVALFDNGPRSADVIANKESLLLKISAAAFQKLQDEASDLAAPFLYAVSKTLIARIRADNRRYRDSIAFVRTLRK
jgi:hypothetical protein